MNDNPNNLAPGEQLYKPDKNPHLRLKNVGHGWIWRCHACQMLASLWALANTACPIIPSPCLWCGHVAICAWDCMGMELILNDPSIDVASVEALNHD